MSTKILDDMNIHDFSLICFKLHFDTNNFKKYYTLIKDIHFK